MLQQARYEAIDLIECHEALRLEVSELTSLGDSAYIRSRKERAAILMMKMFERDRALALGKVIGALMVNAKLREEMEVHPHPALTLPSPAP